MGKSCALFNYVVLPMLIKLLLISDIDYTPCLEGGGGGEINIRCQNKLTNLQFR